MLFLLKVAGFGVERRNRASIPSLRGLSAGAADSRRGRPEEGAGGQKALPGGGRRGHRPRLAAAAPGGAGPEGRGPGGGPSGGESAFQRRIRLGAAKRRDGAVVGLGHGRGKTEIFRGRPGHPPRASLPARPGPAGPGTDGSGPAGAQLLARELGIAPESPVTAEQARKWVGSLEEGKGGLSHGTVGAVALDDAGRLAAATSTGGAGGNLPERMSDSSTVAGIMPAALPPSPAPGSASRSSTTGWRSGSKRGSGTGSPSWRLPKGSSRRPPGGAATAGIGVDREGNWVSFRTTGEMIFSVMSRDRSSPLTG